MTESTVPESFRLATFAAIASVSIAWHATASAQAAAAPAPVPPASAPATLAPVVVTGRLPADAGVAGFDDAPLATAPLSASTIDARQMRDAGARRLADLARFDAAVADAYASEGYIDYFTVRGFVIDNRFNFRRDGLPINAETSIPLDNKARVDVLKGTSGIQAGTSAPGGLVDLVVKRPLAVPHGSAFVEWRERGSVLGSVDIGRRFGADGAFGVRVNAAAERIDPEVRDARGRRHLLAIAGEWRAGAATLIEAEVETSRRTQPSVPGFSLLGDRVPEVPDPRLNLNNQSWSQPNVFDATTASLRWTQALGAGDWRLVVHGATQRLGTDDRLAFPFGCFSANPPPDGTYFPDRFCPDGTYDLYDFRSDDERRRLHALDVSIAGTVATGPIAHRVKLGVLRRVAKLRFQTQAFNFAGTGTIDGQTQVPPAPDLTFPFTDRDERSTELHLRDRIELGAVASVWLGARHTRIDRSSISTEGTGATRYRQSFTTPFVAATWAPRPGQIVYASWGRGVESDVAPALPRYANAGEALPAARSRQVELGWKGGSDRLEWNVALFDIERPLYGDIGACDVDASCKRGLDGEQRHRGVDAQAEWQSGAWTVRGGMQWLHARVSGRANAALDGRKPPNVPAFGARAGVDYRVGAVPGLALQGAVTHDGEREALPDNSVRIGSVTRVDVGARHSQRAFGTRWTWRLGIDNVFDRRAWRESPYQFNHAYLFPLAPRTVRVSLQADL